MRQIFGIAASTLIAAVLVTWLMLTNGTPARAAFAEMLQAVDTARTVVFTTQAQVRGAGEKFQMTTMILKPDWIREETRHGHVTIFNMREHKSLSLSADGKKAVLRDTANVPPAQRKNFIEQISMLRESSAEFLGRKRINGTEALKYRATHPTGHYLMWFTPEDHLPVKIVISESGEKKDAYVTATLTDFQWNVPLDESLFTLEVPKGYEFRKEEAEQPSLDPKNFIATLKAYVRLNSEQFPDEFNALTPGSMVKFLDDPSLPPDERMANYRRKLAHAVERPELANLDKKQWQKHGQEIGRVFAHGAVFLQVLSLTHEWHYVGKGIKLGEAGKIVAWWAPKQANGDEGSDQPRTATVLYGDLHIETKPVEGLPRADNEN